MQRGSPKGDLGPVEDLFENQIQSLEKKPPMGTNLQVPLKTTLKERKVHFPNLTDIQSHLEDEATREISPIKQIKS